MEAFDYPWPTAPALGTALALRAGVHWLRMPLPFALDHINLWLLEDEHEGAPGYTSIDCGITSDETRAAWEQIFDTVLAPQHPLLRVIATHFHPDHLGLAWWLTTGGEHARWNVPLWMSATEYTLGRVLSAGNEASGAAMVGHFARHGLTDSVALAKVRARGGGYYPKMVPRVPQSFVRVHDGDVITTGRTTGQGGQRHVWRVIVGHGHAPEHLSLYCEAQGVLIAGDMVLPRISTNVGVFDLEPEANPLPRYLASLEALRALPADTLVLPSHGLPFVGLHTRIDQQQAHHRARLDEVLAACASPQTAADIVPVLFKRDLDLHQTTFALGEALAHLHALWFDGQLVRTLGADAVYRFAVPT